MPIPNQTNKENFKQYIRHFRNKFSSRIQPIELSYLEPMFSQWDNTIPLSTNVNFVIFDNKETIDVTTQANNNEFLYFPGLAGDTINLQIGTDVYSLGFNANDDGILYDGNTYRVNNSFTLGSKVFTVKGQGGGLVSIASAPTYTISQSATSVNEGDTVTFTISTTNVPDGTTLYYTIAGTATASDFTDALSEGSITVSNNAATITKTLLNDLSLNASEGQETFTLSIRENSVTGTVLVTSNQITVADTSTASYSASISSNTIDEGTSVTVTVTTTGVTDGTVLYYTTSGTASTTSDISSTSGSFTINSNTGSFSITALQDYQADAAETLTINIRTGSVSGQIVDTVGPITITDIAFTMTLTPTATVFDESTINSSSAVTVNVATTNVADGTTFTARVVTSSTITSGDFSSLSTTFTITNNAATFSLPITRDGKTEGLETFSINAENSNGTVVANSGLIAITDRSYIGSRRTGKTFGPIQVNRDNGVVANASDWYNLCNLSNVPDGSKIAIFIDGSGSMTQSTIQASLDKLTAELTARQITFIIVTNSNEDWITPFDVPLN